MDTSILVPNYLRSKLFSMTNDEGIRRRFIREYYAGNDTWHPDILADETMSKIAIHLGYHFCNSYVKNEMLSQQPDFSDKLVRLGTKYGGWHVFPQMLSEESIVYSVGAGTDISFDLEVIEKFNCCVYSIDPTPQAMEYVFKIAQQNKKLLFYPYGLFSRDTILRFYRSRSANEGSLSATNLRQTDWFTEAPVRRLRTLMKQFKHDHIDILKLDIEGAEYDVIEDIFFERLDVRQISVEFDQPVPPWRSERCIKNILFNGYTLVQIDSLNLMFVRNDILAKYL